MTKNKIKYFLIIAVLAISYPLFSRFSETFSSYIPKPPPQTPMWPFTLKLIFDGKNAVSQGGETEQFVHDSDYKGKFWVMHFWATWCGICRNEKPMLTRLAKELQTLDIPMLGVATYDDTVKVLKHEFSDPHGYPIAFDPEGEIALRYKARTLPHTFVIDDQGLIILKIDGPIQDAEMQHILQLAKTSKRNKKV